MMDVTRMRGEVTIRVEGEFDSSEACRLAGWLREVPQHEPLVLDFSGTRHCQDHGIATIARELSGRADVRVRGLSRHQEKLLGYFGIDLRAAAASPAAG
jgi:hypothetical protein